MVRTVELMGSHGKHGFLTINDSLRSLLRDHTCSTKQRGPRSTTTRERAIGARLESVL